MFDQVQASVCRSSARNKRFLERQGRGGIYRGAVAGFCALALALFGCGSNNHAPKSSGSTSAPATSAKVTTAITPGSVAPSVASVAVTKPPTPTRGLGAPNIVDGLKTRGLPIGQTAVYTVENDPNHLLGRPGQYTSKVNFVDSRVGQASSSSIEVSDGGSVEAFSSASDAQKRAAYIATISQSVSSLVEYDYQSGPEFLRLSSKLTPDQAKQYVTALGDILGQPVVAITAVPSSP